VEKHASLFVWSVSDKEKKVLKLRFQKRKNLMEGKKDPPKVIYVLLTQCSLSLKPPNYRLIFITLSGDWSA
jgi:hypothetical protein